jgi:glycosyltransferase involved in cell wall biosynthesis
MFNYHFIIFSYLEVFGGGRETWLNQFVLELLLKYSKSKVFIYYITDKKHNKSNLIPILENPRVYAIPISIPVSSGIISSCCRILSFVGKVFYQLVKVSDSHSKIIAVGSYYEGMVIFLLHIFKKSMKNPSLYIWLRTIWRLQVLAIHQGKLAKFTVLLESWFLKAADGVIANGWDTAEAYKKYNNIDAFVIPNAILLKNFKKRKSWLLANGIFRVSYIGRLSEEKGLLDFLHSVECFNVSYPSLREKVVFEVVGDGPLSTTVHDFVLREHNLKFIGKLDAAAIPVYLSQTSASVSLTYSSGKMGGAGVSNGLLEVLASEVLVICWDNPIFNQVVNNSSALMVNEHEVQGLADAYKYMIDKPLKASNLAAEGRRVVHKFTFDNHMKLFSDLMSNQKLT